MLEEEAETAGGAGDTGRPLTATAGESEGSGAEDESWGEVADGGATTDVTSGDTDAAGEGGRHRAGRGERAKVVGRRENPSVESSWVVNREGGHEALGVGESPGEDRQGVEGAVELPQGIDTHEVEEFLQGGETSRVTTKGEGVPGEDGQGLGGDGNLPTT